MLREIDPIVCLGRKADLHYPFTASQIEAPADIHDPDLQICVAVMTISA